MYYYASHHLPSANHLKRSHLGFDDFIRDEAFSNVFHNKLEMIECGILPSKSLIQYPAGIYMFKVNNRTTRTRCEIC